MRYQDLLSGLLKSLVFVVVFPGYAAMNTTENTAEALRIKADAAATAGQFKEAAFALKHCLR